MSRIFIPFIFDAFTDQTPNLSIYQSIQLGQRAAGVGDVVSTQKAPKPRYGQKKAEPKPAASKRGHGTQHAKQAKTKVAPPKKTKTKPE